MSDEQNGEGVAVNQNIVKCRDDFKPVFLIMQNQKDASQPPRFALMENSVCSWAKKDDVFGPDKLRSRIEPWELGVKSLLLTNPAACW